ncbi:Uncharacterised protein [uncultured archaeon]|nr:Uncharacterised protein [uncultured archaeon]
MKFRNNIGYLGLIGFLGLLGLVTGNTGFYGFFGAFGFFGAVGGRGRDERVERNINRACRNAFVLSVVASSISLAYAGAFKAVENYPLLLALPFVGSMLLFALSYTYYDRKGDVE